MMIFILASGYLFAVYLLLALAKRSGKSNTLTPASQVIEQKETEDLSVTQKVTEVSS